MWEEKVEKTEYWGWWGNTWSGVKV